MLMKKRCLQALLFLLAVVLMSAMAAGRTQEFSGEILSGENIDIDEFTFIITMNKYANAIFIDAGEMYQSVSLGECEDMESFEICFDNTTYDEEDNELYADVTIYRYKPDVSISKTINQTDLYVGQEAQATITISNTGDTAPHVIMTDDYPADMEIYDMEGPGCSVHENQVYWDGHLDEGESRQCSFIIRSDREMHQSFVAHLKYWDGFKWVDEYSSTLTLDFETKLEVETAIVREDYEVDGKTFDFEDDNPGLHIGETGRLMIRISNGFPDHIDVESLDIHIPPEMRYMSTGYLRFNYVNASGDRASIVWNSDRVTKVNDNLLRWDGRITEDDEKLFIIRLRAEKTSHPTVLINTEYDFDDIEMTDSREETIDISDPGVAIRMTIDDKSKRFSAPERLDEEEDSIDLESFHPYHFTVYAQNINKHSRIQGADVKVYTDLAGFKTRHYTTIEEEGQVIPYSLDIIPPPVESSKDYKMNISVKYENEYGESFANSTEFTITVKPFEDLSIDWDSSEGTVLESNEETEVKVSVRNDRLIEIKSVRVSDTIPAGLHVEGIHAKKVKLNREADTEVYTYRLTPPIVHNKTRYDITTTVSFFDPDMEREFNFSETSTLTVEPLIPDISIDVTLDEPEDIYPGSLIPVEYTVKNDEEEELVRGITVRFPVQENIDLIGPRTFMIDKLDPGEEIVIKDLVRLRPKVADDSLELNMTVVEYHDGYGNTFHENSSDDTLDVERAEITGPAVFMKTIVPGVINVSAEAPVEIEVKNNGSIAADVYVTQWDRAWNLTVPAYSTRTVKYRLEYDKEGNYTIPAPEASFRFQDIEGHTKGKGAEAKVRMLLGPSAEPEEEEEEAVAEPVEEAEQEKEEMSFEEYEQLEAARRMREITRYGLFGIVAIVTLLLIAGFIYYQRRKGPSRPFMEVEEKK